jgi:hypothetical protein
MSTSDEKPWILDTGSYRLDPVQITNEERDNIIKDYSEKKEATLLKDGSFIGLSRLVKIIKNPHYVSPEEIKRGRKLRALKDEYFFQKKQGVVKNIDEFVELIKKRKKDMKKFREYIKAEGEGENEKERTT